MPAISAVSSDISLPGLCKAVPNTWAGSECPEPGELQGRAGLLSQGCVVVWSPGLGSDTGMFIQRAWGGGGTLINTPNICNSPCAPSFCHSPHPCTVFTSPSPAKSSKFSPAITQPHLSSWRSILFIYFLSLFLLPPSPPCTHLIYSGSRRLMLSAPSLLRPCHPQSH